MKTNSPSLSSMNYSKSDSFEMEIDSQRLNTERLKKKIKSRLLKNLKWQNNGSQLLISYPGEDQKQLHKVFKIMGSALLLDIYDLIFKQHHSYNLVFASARQLILEFELIDEFHGWINDPLIMIAHCAIENARREAKDASVKTIHSINKTAQQWKS